MIPTAAARASEVVSAAASETAAAPVAGDKAAAAGTSVSTPDPLIVRLDGVPSHPVPLNVTIRVGEAAGTVVVVAGPWATSELVAIGVTCYSQGAELQDKKKRM